MSEENYLLTILVVDDDPISLKVLVEHLTQLGYNTETATKGQEAWQLINEYPHKYTAIIADRVMAGIDGIDLLQRIKDSSTLKNIPVIIETGEASPEEFINAIKLGAFDVIYKPVEPKLLMYVVKRAVEKDLLEKQTDFNEF